MPVLSVILGFIYASGDGVEADPEEAVRWFFSRC